MNPALSLRRFLLCGGVGLVLGCCYSLLRPLRRRHCVLADLIFVLCALAAWVYAGFGICQGDPGLHICAALTLGVCLWEMTAGKLLRPLIGAFWAFLWKSLGIFLWPARKILQFFRKIVKKSFATAKKWVTIGGYQNRKRNKGGIDRGSNRQSNEADPPGLLPQQRHAGIGALRHRDLHGRNDRHRRGR